MCHFKIQQISIFFLLFQMFNLPSDIILWCLLYHYPQSHRKTNIKPGNNIKKISNFFPLIYLRVKKKLLSKKKMIHISASVCSESQRNVFNLISRHIQFCLNSKRVWFSLNFFCSTLATALSLVFKRIYFILFSSVCNCSWCCPLLSDYSTLWMSRRRFCKTKKCF